MPEVVNYVEIRYCLDVSQIDNEELGSYQAYGIDVKNECGNSLGTIKDVSLSREKLEDFIEKLNEYELSIFHLEDAVEDFLATF